MVERQPSADHPAVRAVDTALAQEHGPRCGRTSPTSRSACGCWRARSPMACSIRSARCRCRLPLGTSSRRRNAQCLARLERDGERRRRDRAVMSCSRPPPLLGAMGRCAGGRLAAVCSAGVLDDERRSLCRRYADRHARDRVCGHGAAAARPQPRGAGLAGGRAARLVVFAFLLRAARAHRGAGLRRPVRLALSRRLPARPHRQPVGSVLLRPRRRAQRHRSGCHIERVERLSHRRCRAWEPSPTSSTF